MLCLILCYNCPCYPPPVPHQDTSQASQVSPGAALTTTLGELAWLEAGSESGLVLKEM